ncbi:MAG: hypothetical protein K8R99_09545 [Actinomycetia bacterium]|nr:hypothetical protein [Actinomycetes bacterium]
MNRAALRTSLVVCFALSACGGSGSSTPDSTAAESTPTTEPAADMGTADLQFVGDADDASLTGAGKNAQVLCNYPTFEGPTVIRLQLNSVNRDVNISLEVSNNKVVVVAGSNAGETYTSRTFEGTGVTSFDAGQGVQIDTPVVETTPAESNPGTVGVITEVTGSIDCGDQTTGTSTVVFSGDTLEGAIDGGLSPFRVECTTDNLRDTLNLAGTMSVGGKIAFFLTIFEYFRQNDQLAFDASGTITLYESFEDPVGVAHQYVYTASDAIVLFENNAHVSGDLVEQSPASGTPNTIHIEGDVTCGSHVTF